MQQAISHKNGNSNNGKSTPRQNRPPKKPTMDHNEITRYRIDKLWMQVSDKTYGKNIVRTIATGRLEIPATQSPGRIRQSPAITPG